MSGLVIVFSGIGTRGREQRGSEPVRQPSVPRERDQRYIRKAALP